MKKLVSLLLALSLLVVAAAAFAENAENAENQTGVYTVYNETGEKVTELYISDNVSGDKTENLAVDEENDGLAAGEIIVLEYSIPAGEDGNHRLTLSFKTEGGYEAAFQTLSIEEAPVTLLAADAMTGATPIAFAAAQQTGTYTVYNKTGEKVTELYIFLTGAEDKGENLAGEEGLAADASAELTKSIDKILDGSHALTLSFKTEGGYEAAFTTLSIEEAPITLLAADAMTGATPISFSKPE